MTLSIPGKQNLENATAAIEACLALGVPEEFSKGALSQFGGVEGRLQMVREVDGVKFWNDTTGTTAIATIYAIDALFEPSKNLILIMGGADKNLDMSELVLKIKENVSKIVFLPGTGTDKFLAENSFSNFVLSESMADAVSKAREGARAGDNIVMSPAFASFGLFKNEFDRGEQFDAAVKSL